MKSVLAILSATPPASVARIPAHAWLSALSEAPSLKYFRASFRPAGIRRLPRCPRSYRPTRIFRCHRPAPGIPLYQVPRHGRTCTFETPSCIPFSPCCSPQIVVRISSVLSRIPMKLYSRASVRPRNLLFPLLLTFFVFCRRCAPWLGVSPVRLVGGCRIIRWLPPVIPAVGSPAIP